MPKDYILVSLVNKYLYRKGSVAKETASLLDAKIKIIEYLKSKGLEVVSTTLKENVSVTVSNIKTTGYLLKEDAASTIRRTVDSKYLEHIIVTTDTVDMSVLKKLVESGKIKQEVLNEIMIPETEEVFDITAK